MRKIAILIAVLFFSSASIFAQNQVKGKVVDLNGNPIASVSVTIKGTTTGTRTKADGSFELPGQSGTVLQISDVGHLPQTVTYTGNELIVRLETDTKALSEVV